MGLVFVTFNGFGSSFAHFIFYRKKSFLSPNGGMGSNPTSDTHIHTKSFLKFVQLIELVEMDSIVLTWREIIQ